MYQREDIIKRLGVQDLPADEQDEIVEIATHHIGMAITDSLGEGQIHEYQAIVDDNQDVITAWLASNVPDYKNSVMFQQFEEGYESDPEKNSPEKLFASVAWIQLNVPNVEALITGALDAYRQELAQA